MYTENACKFQVNFNDLVDGGGAVGASTSTSTAATTTTTTTSTAVTITTTTTTKKNPRGKGKLYEPYCSLKSIEAADQMLSKQQWLLAKGETSAGSSYSTAANTKSAR